MLNSSKFSVRNFLIPHQKVLPLLLHHIITKGIHSFIKGKLPAKQVKVFPSSKYGGENIVTLLTGTTFIGEMGAKFIRALFETAKVPVVFERIELGPGSKTAPQEFVNSVRRNRCALHADIHFEPEQKQEMMLLNNELDLYACIIRLESFEGYNCRHPDADITLIIQNNVGDYTKLEYEPVPGIVETLKIVEAGNIERYVRFSFNYAKQNCRKKITLGHKERELPRADGMFLEIAEKVHKEYPDIELETMSIDEVILKLIMDPLDFDMICAGDRYGTIVASIASAVCGGPSLFSATELGDHHAIFKPLQTKLSISEIRTLSPYGIVRCCIDMLDHLGNHECSQIMWDELMTTMFDRDIKTKEYGGNDSSEYIICDIVNRLKCKPF